MFGWLSPRISPGGSSSPKAAVRRSSSTLSQAASELLTKLHNSNNEDEEAELWQEAEAHAEIYSEEWMERIVEETDVVGLLSQKVDSVMLGQLAEELIPDLDERMAAARGAAAKGAADAAAEVGRQPKQKAATSSEAVLSAHPSEATLSALGEDLGEERRTMHRPCAACKLSKVKCDYLQPCSRCVRLGIGHTCRPPPEVKRGRPPKQKGGSDAAGSGKVGSAARAQAASEPALASSASRAPPSSLLPSPPPPPAPPVAGVSPPLSSPDKPTTGPKVSEAEHEGSSRNERADERAKSSRVRLDRGSRSWLTSSQMSDDGADTST